MRFREPLAFTARAETLESLLHIISNYALSFGLSYAVFATVDQFKNLNCDFDASDGAIEKNRQAAPRKC